MSCKVPSTPKAFGRARCHAQAWLPASSSLSERKGCLPGVTPQPWGGRLCRTPGLHAHPQWGLAVVAVAGGLLGARLCWWQELGAVYRHAFWWGVSPQTGSDELSPPLPSLR